MLFYFTIKIIVNFLYLINVLIFWKKLFHPILLVKTCTGKLLRWYWHVKVKWLKILEVIYNQEYPFFSNHSIMLRKVNFFIRLRLFLLKPYVSIDFFHKFSAEWYSCTCLWNTVWIVYSWRTVRRLNRLNFVRAIAKFNHISSLNL